MHPNRPANNLFVHQNGTCHIKGRGTGEEENAHRVSSAQVRAIPSRSRFHCLAPKARGTPHSPRAATAGVAPTPRSSIHEPPARKACGQAVDGSQTTEPMVRLDRAT